MTVIAQPPNPFLGIVSVVAFVVIVVTLLYIFREKKPETLPEDITYNFEGKITNSKIDKQLEYNAYLHTLAPSYKGAIYGLHNDRRKKK